MQNVLIVQSVPKNRSPAFNTAVKIPHNIKEKFCWFKCIHIENVFLTTSTLYSYIDISRISYVILISFKRVQSSKIEKNCKHFEIG